MTIPSWTIGSAEDSAAVRPRDIDTSMHRRPTIRPAGCAGAALRCSHTARVCSAPVLAPASPSGRLVGRCTRRIAGGALGIVMLLAAGACRAPRPPVSAGSDGCRRSVAVAGSAALAQALAGASAGDCLELADGDYAFAPIRTVASAEAPLSIRAVHRGKAVVSSGSIVFDQAAHVTVEGLLFTSSGHIGFHDAHHCRLTRCRIHPDERKDVDWVDIGGRSHHIRIDHNDFGPKRVMGNMVMLNGAGGQVVQYNQIDHNYFHDISYGGGNGWETRSEE